MIPNLPAPICHSLHELVTMDRVKQTDLLFTWSDEIFVLYIAPPRQLPNSLPYGVPSRIRPKQERVVRVPIPQSFTSSCHAHLPPKLRLALDPKGYWRSGESSSADAPSSKSQKLIGVDSTHKQV
eukprot:423814-Hanusia_phi.AAC.2